MKADDFTKDELEAAKAFGSLIILDENGIVPFTPNNVAGVLGLLAITFLKLKELGEL
jgi:hypothetical protein